MTRLFQLVNQCYRVVLHGNAALLRRIGNELVLAEAKLAGPLTRCEVRGRCQVGPVDRGRFQHVQRLEMRFCDRVVRLGQMPRIDEGDTWGYVQAAGTADYDQPRIGCLAERVDLPLGDIDDLIRMIPRRCIGTDDSVRSRDRGGDVLRVRQVVLLNEHPRWGLRQLCPVSGDGDHVMPTRYELLQDAAPGFAGGSIYSDFHSWLLGYLPRWVETM